MSKPTTGVERVRDIEAMADEELIELAESSLAVAPDVSDGLIVELAKRLKASLEREGRTRQRVIDSFPTNWCDSLLSGKDVPPLLWGCPQIEWFIGALKERIATALIKEAKDGR